MKIDEKALEKAAIKLRKLRMTDSIPIKDVGGPSSTIKSIFKAGLGGLYDDEAIKYMLRFGLKYYFKARRSEG